MPDESWAVIDGMHRVTALQELFEEKWILGANYQAVTATVYDHHLE